jgi:hypothetical protein
MSAIPVEFEIRPGSLDRLRIQHAALYRQIVHGLDRDDPAALEIVEALRMCGDEFVLRGTEVVKTANGHRVGAAMVGGYRITIGDNMQHTEFTAPLLSRDRTHGRLQASLWRRHLAARHIEAQAPDVHVYQSIANRGGQLVKAAVELGYRRQEELPTAIVTRTAAISGGRMDVYSPDITVDNLPLGRQGSWLDLLGRLTFKLNGPSMGSVEVATNLGNR